MSLFSIFSKKPAEPTSVAEALAGVGESSTPKPKTRRAEKRQVDSQNEQLVPEKKRARRRLIGAIAIVLAMVIGLPMVLDSQPKPLNKNIVIQIPSKDGDTVNTSAADSKDDGQDDAPVQPVKQAPVAAADSTERSVATVTPPAAATVAPTADPVPATPKPAKAAAKADPNADAKPDTKHSADTASKKDSATKSKSDGKSSDTQVASSDDSARAMAILSGGADPANGKTKIVVQVGAFATQEKVDELQGKLSAAGIKSFTQKVATSSGDKIRVRIGPFSDKDSADKMKQQLSKIGLNGNLIPL